MGRKALHTQEQVFEVADRMTAGGQEVTPTALLQALGGGSLTTIYKHLDAWQTSKKDAPVQAVFEMPDTVKGAFNAAWQTAANEAAREVAAIREKADIEVKAVARRLEEAISNIEQLESEADADATRIETLERQLAVDKAAADAFATQAVARESALTATVEQMRHQIEGQAAELVRVHADHDSAREAHAAEVARLTADFARQLAEQAEALRLAHEEAARVRAKLDEDAKKSEQAVERLRTRLEEEGAKLALAFERERETVKKLAEVEGDVKRLVVQANDDQVRHAEAVKKLESVQAALRTEATEAVRKLAATAGECEALRAQVGSQLDLINSLASKPAPDDGGQGGAAKPPAPPKKAK
jgi:hypothetical protein